MASKKALLLLFARAARSAAAATYRVASLAERRALFLDHPEAVAAASNAHRFSGGGGRSAAAAAVPTHGTAAPAPAMDAPSPRTGSAPSSKDLKKKNQDCFWVELVPKEEDLESDKALWDLYERWCKAFDQRREPDEMARRFNKFKNRVLEIHSMNNANNQSCKLGLTKFTDGKLAELRANRDPRECKLAKKYPNSCLWNGGGKVLKQVFAEYDVVNGKLFVFFPSENGKGCVKKEISTEYEVISGSLFVADLPEGPELLVPTTEFIRRCYPPYLP